MGRQTKRYIKLQDNKQETHSGQRVLRRRELPVGRSCSLRTLLRPLAIMCIKPRYFFSELLRLVNIGSVGHPMFRVKWDGRQYGFRPVKRKRICDHFCRTPSARWCPAPARYVVQYSCAFSWYIHRLEDRYTSYTCTGTKIWIIKIKWKIPMRMWISTYPCLSGYLVISGTIASPFFHAKTINILNTLFTTGIYTKI